MAEVYELYDKFIFLNGAWEKINGGSGGGTSDVENLSDIKDVKLNNPSNGQVLTYENSKWVNKKAQSEQTVYTAGDGINITDKKISTETRTIDVTQSQYDTLTDTQKMDPSIYYHITDGSGEIVTYELPFKFGIDADGNYGYYKDGADTVTPFKSGSGINKLTEYESIGDGSWFNNNTNGTIFTINNTTSDARFIYFDMGECLNNRMFTLLIYNTISGNFINRQRICVINKNPLDITANETITDVYVPMTDASNNANYLYVCGYTNKRYLCVYLNTEVVEEYNLELYYM